MTPMLLIVGFLAGAVANTIAIAEIDRTWKMIVMSVSAIMMGSSGGIARLALPDSSIEPPSSIRYPAGSFAMTG